MKKRFSEAQIIGFLREAEAGLPVKDLCRRHGFSEASDYLWRSKFGGMNVSDAKRLKELGAENSRLKKLLAESLLLPGQRLRLPHEPAVGRQVHRVEIARLMEQAHVIGDLVRCIARRAHLDGLHGTWVSLGFQQNRADQVQVSFHQRLRARFAARARNAHSSPPKSESA